MAALISTGAGRSGDAGVPRRDRAFPRLWLAQATSQLGDEVYTIAVPLIVYAITGSAGAMALLFGLSLAPHIVAGLVGGTISDHRGPRLLLVSVSAAASLLLAGLTALVALHMVVLPVLAVLTVLLATAASMLMSSYEAAVPTLVPSEELLRANSRLESTRVLLSAAGPLLAGVLAGIGTGALAVGLNALTFAVAAAVIMPVRALDRPTTTRRRSRASVLRSSADGLRQAWRRRPVRWGIIMSTGVNICTGSLDIYAIYLLRHDYAVSPGGVGVIFAGASLFTVATATLLPRFKSRFPPGAGMGTAVVVLASSCAFLASAGGLVSVVAALMTNIWGAVIFNIYWRAVRQQVCGPQLIGRISGICRGIAYAGAAIGAWGGGLLTVYSDAGARIYFGSGAAALLVLAGVGGVGLSRALRAASVEEA